MERALALDIESTTEVFGLPDDLRPGLDPAISAITDIGIEYETSEGDERQLLLTVADDAVAGWTGKETYLTSGRNGRYEPCAIDASSRALVCVDETQMLRLLPVVLREIIRNHRIDTLVTWNGGVFDLPFIADRSARMTGDATVGGLLALTPDPAVYVKYAPIPGHDGGYRALIDGNVRHLDLQEPFKAYAEEHGITHSLKPVGKHAGFDPVEVDREKMHELTMLDRWAYALSDASLTLGLARKFFYPLGLSTKIDPVPVRS